MRKSLLWQAFYWLSTPVLAFVVVLLIRQKLQRSLRIFFVYVFVLFLIDVARLLAYQGRPVTYFYVYWISDAIGTLLALLMVGELFLSRLFPYFYNVTVYRALSLFATLVVMALTIVTAFRSRPALLFSSLFTILHTADFFLSGTLVFFVSLMVLMGRRWGPYDFGIALGVGLNAAALLATLAIFSKSVPLHGILRNLPTLAEDAASIVWLITFLRSPRSASAPGPRPSPQVVEQARNWAGALKDSLTMTKRNQ